MDPQLTPEQKVEVELIKGLLEKAVRLEKQLHAFQEWITEIRPSKSTIDLMEQDFKEFIDELRKDISPDEEV